MDRQLLMERYRSLGLLLLLVAAVTTTIVASCGGGGGSSNGALCQQCGSSDGPCQDTAFVVPGATDPQPCPSVDTTNPSGCEEVDLICRRKSDSAQQRCYPANDAGTDVNFQFRCDGSRPGDARAAGADPDRDGCDADTGLHPVCGNAVLDPGEQCEINLSNPFGTQTCGNFCLSSGGSLFCNGDCTISFTGCTGTGCAFQ